MNQQEYVQKLMQLIQENPNLPIVPMVDYEVCCGEDHSYWMGGWGEAEVDKYYIDDERIWFYSDSLEDLVDQVIDQRFEDEWKDKTDEEMEKLAEGIVKGYKWVECIAVRIELP